MVIRSAQSRSAYSRGLRTGSREDEGELLAFVSWTYR